MAEFVMKNLYKCTDIFRCVHESHQGYKNRISVYHILKEKSCYPNGCIYFRWRCKILNKKKKCHRGYRHVGKNCFGCKEFYEEKIHNFPELQVSQDEYKNFLKKLELFEDWLDKQRFKLIDIAGKVHGVKPHFIQKVFPKTKYLSFRGFMIIFKDIYLDRMFLEDFAYAIISSDKYKRLNICIGDEIEAKAMVNINHGRLILNRLQRIEIVEHGNESAWDEQSISLARETATELREQPESCVQCKFGALVDIEYNGEHRSSKRRKLFCLKGIANYKDCYVKSEYCGLDVEANEIVTGECATIIVN